MKRLGKKIIAAMIVGMATLPCVAQDKVEASIGSDVVSSYLWRGQKNGGVSIQPSATIGWKGLSLGAWGSFAISPEHNGSDEEIDIVLDYAAGNFHVGITDYYLAGGAPFFHYGGLGKSAHTFEATVGYDFGFLSVNWSTNFAGEDGLNGSGKRAYSSYLQLDAPFKLAKLDWTASLGVVPYRTTYYAADNSNGFHINQIALKAEYPIALKHVTMPVFAQVMANPSSQDLFFTAGFGVTFGGK